MPEIQIRPHPVVSFTLRKPPHPWSFSVGSWVGLGAGQGFRLEVQARGWGVGVGRDGVLGKGWVWWVLEGRGSVTPLITLSFPLYFSLPAPMILWDNPFYPMPSLLLPGTSLPLSPPRVLHTPPYSFSSFLPHLLTLPPSPLSCLPISFLSAHLCPPPSGPAWPHSALSAWRCGRLLRQPPGLSVGCSGGRRGPLPRAARVGADRAVAAR